MLYKLLIWPSLRQPEQISVQNFPSSREWPALHWSRSNSIISLIWFRVPPLYINVFTSTLETCKNSFTVLLRLFTVLNIYPISPEGIWTFSSAWWSFSPCSVCSTALTPIPDSSSSSSWQGKLWKTVGWWRKIWTSKTENGHSMTTWC